MKSPIFYREVKRDANGGLFVAWFEYVGTAAARGNRHDISDMIHETAGGSDCALCRQRFMYKHAANAWLDHWEAQFAKMTPMDGDGWTEDEIQDALKAKADEESACRFEASAATQRAEEQACNDTGNRI